MHILSTLNPEYNKSTLGVETPGIKASGTMFVNGYAPTYFTDSRNNTSQGTFLRGKYLVQRVKNYSSYDLWSDLVIVMIPNDDTGVAYYEEYRFYSSSSSFSARLNGNKFVYNYIDSTGYRKEFDLVNRTRSTYGSQDTSGTNIVGTSSSFLGYTCSSNIQVVGSSSTNYYFFPLIAFTK